MSKTQPRTNFQVGDYVVCTEQPYEDNLYRVSEVNKTNGNTLIRASNPRLKHGHERTIDADAVVPAEEWDGMMGFETGTSYRSELIVKLKEFTSFEHSNCPVCDCNIGQFHVDENTGVNGLWCPACGKEHIIP